jgi:hypothetical protein
MQNVYFFNRMAACKAKSELAAFARTIAILMTSFPAATDGAKILLLPANVNSHVLYFSRLATDLARLGHVTRLLAPSNARRPDHLADIANFTYSSYPVDDDGPYMSSRKFSTEMVEIILSRSKWGWLKLAQILREAGAHMKADCVRLLEKKELMEEIRTGGFQFAILDNLALQCYLVVPYSAGIPYAVISVR